MRDAVRGAVRGAVKGVGGEGLRAATGALKVECKRRNKMSSKMNSKNPGNR